MTDFRERLKQAAPGEELRDDHRDDHREIVEVAPPREELSVDERLELHAYSDAVERLRASEPPPLGLGEWQKLVERVRTELRRTDLSSAEKRALMHDVRAEHPGHRFAVWLAVGVGVALAGVAGVLSFFW